MKLCPMHWEKLKAAISTRGLDALVPEQQDERKTEWEAGRPDPLLAANLSIFNMALDVAGLRVLFESDEQENCPICFLKDLVAAYEDEKVLEVLEGWIDQAADVQLQLSRGRVSA